MPSTTELKNGWTYSQVRSETTPDVQEDWQECSIPTSVHVELKNAGKIPDPYKGLNEWACQCGCLGNRAFTST